MHRHGLMVVLIAIASVTAWAEDAGQLIIDEFTGRTFVDHAGAHAGNPNVSNRVMTAVWTDEVPVIDGLADEAAWEGVEEVGDFMKMLAEGQLSTFQSKLRVAFDAEHLYVHIRAIQPNMRETKMGPPPEEVDAVSDVAQVMVQIDPYDRRKGVYWFAISPSGAHQDRGHLTKAEFNVPWETATVVDDEGWSTEMAIPWRELVEGESGRITSPNAGDVWGFNVNRVEPTTGEISQWSLSGGSVGSYGAIGRVFFASTQASAASLKHQVKHGGENRLHPGAGHLSVGLEPTAKEATVRYRLTRDGAEVDTGELALTGDVQVPFHLTGGGRWEMDLAVHVGGRVIQTARYRHTMPRIEATLAAMMAELDEAARYLDRTAGHPSHGDLTSAVASLRSEAGGLREALEDAESLSPQAWEAVLDRWDAVEGAWARDRLNLSLLRHYPSETESQAFHVGVVGVDRALTGSALPPEDAADRIELALAGRETESAQVLVYPYWQAVQGLEVTFSDLTGEAGVIASENLGWSIVEDVETIAEHPWRGTMPSPHPDILMPGEPFDAEAEKAHRLWINVFAPPGTAAGDYRGELVVSGGGQRSVVPVEVQVYGFDLPLANTLEHHHWLWYHRWRRFSDKPLSVTPEMFERHLKVLSRYRAAEHLGDPSMWNRVGISIDADGEFDFDFSGLDPFIELGKAYGANTFWSVMGYHYRYIPMFNPRHAERTRVTKLPERQRVSMSELIPQWLEANQDPDAADFTTHPAYPTFLTQWVAYLRGKGILETAYFETVDEADRRESWWLDMLEHNEFLREHVPELPILSFGATPWVEHAGRNAIGLMDAWCPHLYHMEDESLVAELKQRRAQYGEKYWFYVCTERQFSSNPDRQWSPHVIIGRPWSTMRVIPWMGWDYEIDGFFLYALLTNPPKENAEPPVEERWPRQRWHAGMETGSGLLVYLGPAPEYRMIPSLRLSHLRDGMEDYEYFNLLRERLDAAGDEVDADLRERVERALVIEPEIVAGVYEWTTDLDRFDRKRRELAELIEQLGQITEAR